MVTIRQARGHAGGPLCSEEVGLGTENQDGYALNDQNNKKRFDVDLILDLCLSVRKWK